MSTSCCKMTGFCSHSGEQSFQAENRSAKQTWTKSPSSSGWSCAGAQPAVLPLPALGFSHCKWSPAGLVWPSLASSQLSFSPLLSGTFSHAVKQPSLCSDSHVMPQMALGVKTQQWAHYSLLLMMKQKHWRSGGFPRAGMRELLLKCCRIGQGLILSRCIAK